MTGNHRRHSNLVLAAAINLIGQAAVLAALALAGEWRVWRFLCDFAAQLDALLVLGWWAWKLRHPVPASRGL
jgi:hypothetical protein